MPTFRYEQFGGIVHLERRRSLVFVDRAYARRLGHHDESHWASAPEHPLGSCVLSAPLEAHLQLTNRCENGCQACYTGATPAGAPRELDLDGWKRAIDELAAMGVFHLALGGGESGDLPWLGAVARHARARGLVPNLTTSGQVRDLDALVAAAPLFGQINVSVDGVGDVYRQVRGYDGFARADEAIVRLRRVTRFVGLNCVVCRANFDHLSDLARYAKRRKLHSIELLRLKPVGRAAAVYDALRCTDAQHHALLPSVLSLVRRHRILIRLDCSMTPLLTAHTPSPRLLRWLGVMGCVGGDYLVAAKAHGPITACSFAAPPAGGPQAGALAPYWRQDEAFGPFRAWRNGPEPCRSCDYLTICRGGCRAISAHVCGDPAAPDPECPRVIAAVASGSLSKRDASYAGTVRSEQLKIFTQ